MSYYLLQTQQVQDKRKSIPRDKGERVKGMCRWRATPVDWFDHAGTGTGVVRLTVKSTGSTLPVGPHPHQ